MKSSKDRAKRSDSLSRAVDSLDEAARRTRETALVGGCLKRDWPSFDRLVNEYTKWVQSGAHRAKTESARPRSCEVKDLVQQFFFRLCDDPAVFKKWDSSRPLGPWLSGVAHHWSQEYLRSRAVDWRIRLAPEVRAEGIPSNEPAREPIDPAPIVAKILAHFSSTTGDIVQARYGVGKYGAAQSVAEIAARHQMTESQVYYCVARIRRVRKLMRREDIGEFFGEDEK